MGTYIVVANNSEINFISANDPFNKTKRVDPRESTGFLPWKPTYCNHQITYATLRYLERASFKKK